MRPWVSALLARLRPLALDIAERLRTCDTGRPETLPLSQAAALRARAARCRRLVNLSPDRRSLKMLHARAAEYEQEAFRIEQSARWTWKSSGSWPGTRTRTTVKPAGGMLDASGADAHRPAAAAFTRTGTAAKGCAARQVVEAGRAFPCLS